MTSKLICNYEDDFTRNFRLRIPTIFGAHQVNATAFCCGGGCEPAGDPHIIQICVSINVYADVSAYAAFIRALRTHDIEKSYF